MKASLLTGLFLIANLFSKSQNEFAFNLYNTFGEKENVLISPVSIKTAFAMAYEGAKGNTKNEFDSVFNFRLDNSAFVKELEGLKKVSDINNSLWFKKGLKVEKTFKNKLNNLYKSEPFTVDFKNKPKATADTINDWIKEKTKGLIPKMVDASTVQGLNMAIVNTIYFKQDWAITFDKKETKKRKFKNIDKSKSNIDFMCARRYFSAQKTEDEEVITLPYKDGKTSMLIIMPNKMKGYEMNNKKYSQLTSYVNHQEVIFKMPKFTFETPVTELKDKIKGLGLKQAVSNKADFGSMTKQESLKISTVLHKAKIIVNEEGTEAAAATVIPIKH